MRSRGKAQEEAESCAWRNSRWEMYGLHTAEGPGPLWTAPDAGLPGSPGFLCPCAAPITHADLNSHIFADSVAMGEFSEGGAAGPWGPPSAGTRMSSKGLEPSLLHSTVGRAAANFSFPRDVDVTQSETISSHLCPMIYWRILMLCSVSDV